MRKSVVENGLNDMLAYGDALKRFCVGEPSLTWSVTAVRSMLAVAITHSLTYLPARAVRESERVGVRSEERGVRREAIEASCERLNERHGRGR